MSTALSAFEYETSRALIEEELEQLWRRYVEVGGDAFSLESFGLIGAAAGDKSEAGVDRANDLELFLAKLFRNESQDADTPRSVSQEVLGLAQQFFDLGGSQ